MPTYHLTYKRQQNRKDNLGKIESKRHFDYICRESTYKNIRNHGEDLRHKSNGNLPFWAKEPGLFWDAADNNERKNGCAYREIQVGLAQELSLDYNIKCVEKLLEELGIKKEHAYSYAIHEKPAQHDKDMTNIHAHIMFNERAIEKDREIKTPEDFFKRYSTNKNNEPTGGYKKNPRFEDKFFLQDTRKRWEKILNEKLKENGIDEEVSCETLQKQKEKMYSKGENQIADMMNREPAPKMAGLFRNPNIQKEIDKKISDFMRMHSGALVAAKKGKWLGGIVPFGYLTDKDGFLVINREKIPGLDYTEEDIVKIVFSLCANENKSSIEIADYVNALGVPTRYIPGRNLLLRKRPGKRLRNNAPLWGPSRVLRMLRNSLYKGYRVYGLRATLKDYEPIEQQVPAIVDEDTWNRANRVISSKYFLTPRRRQGRHLLQGYLYCGHCGHTYCGYADRLKKDRQTYYYRCNGRDAYNPAWRCDSSAGINADWIEQLVLDYCASVLREHSFLEPAPAKEKMEDCTALEVHTLNSAIKRLATEKDSILSLYRKNLITMDDLTRQLELIRQERKALQKRVEELKQPTTEEIIAQNRQTSAEFFRRFQDIFPRDYDLRNLSFQTCRDILELFIDRVTIYTVKNNDKSFYASFRVELQDKLGNTKTYSIAATDRLKTQQNKIGKKLSSLSEKLRSLRLERGYTQKTVAEHIGLSVNVVNAFENQRRSQTNPAFQHHTIRKLADFYGIPYEALAIWNYSSVETGGHKLFAQIRDVKGITNDELLADIGVSKPTFRKYLKGIATEQTRQKIESYFATARKWLKKIMQSR